MRCARQVRSAPRSQSVCRYNDTPAPEVGGFPEVGWFLGNRARPRNMATTARRPVKQVMESEHRAAELPGRPQRHTWSHAMTGAASPATRKEVIVPTGTSYSRKLGPVRS